MDDGSTSLTYFSVINSPAKGFDPIPYFEKTGKVTVELTWKLYKCPPDAATLAKFPNVGIDQSNIGWDEYVHTKWTDKDPGITVKPLAEGKIDAAITWTALNNESISFTSSNKDIQKGPNREGRPYYKFTNWEYKDGKWQRFVRP